MVFVLIFLWTIAAVLLVNNPKNETTRWVAFTAFTAGGGGLSRTMTETVIPYLHKHELSSPGTDAFLFKLHIVGSFMNHNGMPYCFLLFAICYSGYFSGKAKKIFACLLPIPIVVMLFITPMTPDIQLDFKILFFWCAPYLVAGLLLLFISYFRETVVLIRRNRFYTLLFSAPPIIFQIFVNYTFKAFFDFAPVGQENVMARLDKANAYLASQEVKPGTYKVDFINIVGENASDFNINSPEQIVIKEGEAAKFQLQIALKKPKPEPETNTAQPIQGSTVEPVSETEPGGSAASSVPVPEAVKDVLAPAVVQPAASPVLNSNTVNTLIGLVVVALLALLYFLYKQISYKHDYYDC